MFAPKWKKEAKLLDKAAKKFLNYKRDLLDEKQIAEIESRRDDLRNARKSSDKDGCAEASKQLQATCEGALPRQQSQGWVEENLEVIFVAIVIALGLRAYVVQPFRIPTGSMQPTLNGIVATPVNSADDFPSFAVRQLQRASHGRSYVDLVLDEDKQLRAENPIEEAQFLHFFTRTYIYFKDGSKMTFPGPKTALMSSKGMNFAETCGYRTNEMTTQQLYSHYEKARTLGASNISLDIKNKNQVPYLKPKLPAGTVIARGYIDTGDLILVDKMSYHFRKPSRGEVFVFDTRGIKKIHEEARKSGGIAGSHYIKRLGAVPGDTLQLKNIDRQQAGDLYINDELATEPGFLNVMSKEGDFAGYKASERLAPNKIFKARDNRPPGMNEYIALGDNSYNSSDSRHWGTVKEFNVIGPAAFSLWPFKSGHWGFIK